MKLRNLLRPVPPETDGAPGHLQDAVRRAAGTVWRDPRVQDVAAGLRERAREWRGEARSRADAHLETLLERRYGQSGETPPEAVTALLDQRRREREARAAALRVRQALLAQADTPEQRRVLTRVAQVTPWAGGEAGEVRYTALLDALAPSSRAEDEMAVHRAIWTLAERRVLAVSPHGTVTACPPPPPRVLPERAGT